MLARNLWTSLLLLAPLAGVAQAQNAPALNQPSHWEIQDENGPIGFSITVNYWFTDPLGWDWYWTQTTDDDGEVVGGGYLAQRPDQPNVCMAYSTDSGLWYWWRWDTDHFAKVGGSAAVRNYYPK